MKLDGTAPHVRLMDMFFEKLFDAATLREAALSVLDRKGVHAS